MSDFLKQIGGPGAGSMGRSPIIAAGRIAMNALRDRQEIEVRKRKIKQGTSAIGGGSDENIFVMQRYNPAISIRGSKRRARGVGAPDPRIAQDIDLYIVDAANGLGDYGQTQEQLNEMIGNVYVVGTNKMVEGEADSVAVLVGGLATMRNWGPEPIQVGDWVVISAPDPEHPQPYPAQMDRPIDKIMLWTLPYRPDRSVMSLRIAYAIITNQADVIVGGNIEEFKRAYPYSSNGARVVAQSIEATSFATLLAGVSSGYITLAAGRDREQNRRRFSSMGKKEKREIVRALAMDTMTLSNGDGDAAGFLSEQERRRERVTVPHLDGTGDVAFNVHLAETIFAQNPKYWAVQPDDLSARNGAPIVTDPLEEQILGRQRNNLGTFVAGIRHADMAEKRRIIGRAISHAETGEDFDIHIGQNIH